jgi:hypothetical protein
VGITVGLGLGLTDGMGLGEIVGPSVGRFDGFEVGTFVGDTEIHTPQVNSMVAAVAPPITAPFS